VTAFQETCRALLAENRPVRFRASGSSMEPTIPADTLLTVAPCARAPERGDIVLYTRESRVIAHRVRRRERGFLICQGDHFRSAEEHVREDEVLGLVVSVGEPGRPPGPRRRLARELARARAAVGWASRRLLR
jgi:hypothetical protein